jgi:hypothetical protein
MHEQGAASRTEAAGVWRKGGRGHWDTDEQRTAWAARADCRRNTSRISCAGNPYFRAWHCEKRVLSQYNCAENGSSSDCQQGGIAPVALFNIPTSVGKQLTQRQRTTQLPHPHSSRANTVATYTCTERKAQEASCGTADPPPPPPHPCSAVHSQTLGWPGVGHDTRRRSGGDGTGYDYSTPLRTEGTNNRPGRHTFGTAITSGAHFKLPCHPKL